MWFVPGSECFRGSDSDEVCGLAFAGLAPLGEKTPGSPPILHCEVFDCFADAARSYMYGSEKRLLDEFCSWCRREVKSLLIEPLFNMAPELFPSLLRCYGDILFQRGGALSNLRHLLLACQRWKPLCRPYMHQCWELVGGWEAQQPVQHRTSLPETLVKAMRVVGWMHGWYGWALATAISF